MGKRLSLRCCRKCGALFNTRDCKACAVVNNKKYRAANVEKIRIYHSEYRAKNSGKVKAKWILWAEANAEKMKAYKEKYRKENAERVTELQKQWKKLNKEKVRKYGANYRAANQEKIKAKNGNWAKQNKEKARIYVENRRARKKQNGGTLSPDLAIKLFKLQKGKCPCCGESLGKDYQLDHKMPLFLGGANEDWNIQLLRRRCNRQKHAMNPVDFMQTRGFLL